MPRTKQAKKPAVAPEFCCSNCQKKQAARKTRGDGFGAPSGWKKFHEQVYCKACVKSLYRLRAVTLPVTSVLEGGTWKEFCTALHKAWRSATDLANFAVKQLVAGDVQRQPGEADWGTSACKTMPKIDLYRHLKKGSKCAYPGIAEWDGNKSSATSLLRTVEAKYRARRYEVIWLGQAAPMVHKYPQPYPIHNREWEAEYRKITDTDGEVRLVPVVRLRLGGKWWTLRLRGGYCVRKHLAGFSHIVNGAAIQGELALYGVPSARKAHRRVMEHRSPGGGNGQATRILCKMAAYLPNDRKEKQREGTLVVRTGGKALLIAQLGEERPWVLKNNQVRTWIFRHERFRADIGDDMKNERRPKRKRVRIQEKIDSKCEKHANQIKTFVQTTAAHLTAYADRRGVATVEYHDYDRRYFPDRFDGRSGFPWAMLRDRIKAKLEEYGISFVHIDHAREIVIGDNANGDVMEMEHGEEATQDVVLT